MGKARKKSEESKVRQSVREALQSLGEPGPTVEPAPKPKLKRAPRAAKLTVEPSTAPEPEPEPVVAAPPPTQPHAPAVMRFEIGEHPAVEEIPRLARDVHFFAPSNLDRAVLCRQLATLIEVGIPLLRALQMLSKRTAHPALARATADAARRVEEGQTLSQAMEASRDAFSPLVCNIIRVGEAGGILEPSLIRLAQIMESKAEIRRKVTTALMYPCVALLVAVLVIMVILVKAVPVFSAVYMDSGQQLPAPTRFVIGLSNLAVGGFWLWILLLVGGGFGAAWWGRTPQGRHWRSLVSLRIPTISILAKKIAAARFSRTLGGLLVAGIPLAEAMSISADTNENLVVGERLRAVQEGIERGQKITRPLAEAAIFPPMVVDMIGIGEETGTLDTMLQKIADIYDADVDSMLHGLSTIIEPLLIVLLGLIVVFIAMAVMLPYFNLVQIV